MTDRRVTTKSELLADIERTWAALNAALDRLTEEQMTTLRDTQGWTVKDHLVHLTAWERSVVFLLQGKPRHEGLGVDESVYSSSDFDQQNAVIQQRHKDVPLAEARRQFREAHGQLMALVGLLTDADLQKPYRHYLPDEADDDRPLLAVVDGNSANHFAEHLEWIEALVNTAPKT